MVAIDSSLGAKLVFLLGITNIISGILLFVSCRCQLSPTLQRNKLFMKLYRHHCKFWTLFFLSVFMHAIIAILTFENPF